MKEKVQKFIVSMLDPNGQISFGRTMALMSLVAILSWDTANLVFAWKFNHHLPAGMGALPLLPDASTMVGQAAFAGTFYGVTKVGDIKRMESDGDAGDRRQGQ